MAKGRKGRPRKANARSRSTTRAGRASPPDFGPPEIQRLRQILILGRPGLPVDPLGALFARDLIDEQAHRGGRFYAMLVMIIRRGWQLSEGSVQGLWRALLVGSIGDIGVPIVTASANGHDRSAGDFARAKVEAMRDELWRPGEDGAVFHVTQSICVDGTWRDWLKRLLTNANGARLGRRSKGDFGQLGLLREGLHRLAEMENLSPRRREVLPTEAAAE